MKGYVMKVLVGAFDMGTNVWAGGYPGMTISSRAYTGREDGKRMWTWLADRLDWLQQDHCYRALLNDIDRANAVVRDLSRYLRT